MAKAATAPRTFIEEGKAVELLVDFIDGFSGGEEAALSACLEVECGVLVQAFVSDGGEDFVDSPAPNAEGVYNSESNSEPVYRVGESGVLVHNTSQGPNPITKADGEREVADIQRQFNIDPDQVAQVVME